MNKMPILLLSLVISQLFSLAVEAQSLDRKLLYWEQKKINIGAVLEENGAVTTEFFGLNNNDSTIIITDVITDCGCTSVDYSQDSLQKDMIASIKVQFDPDQKGGAFSKKIIIRTTADIYGDTLYLEGINMPIPENLDLAYPHRVGNVGFRQTTINMGKVFTNSPKTKYVEVHNFGTEDVVLGRWGQKIPDHLTITLEPSTIPAGKRGLMVINYDGLEKNDLGFFEENVSLNLFDQELPLDIKLIAVVYEYYPPVPKSMEYAVPKLGISDVEVDLRTIKANTPVSKSIVLTNLGPEPLQIKKIATTCDCVTFKWNQEELHQGEQRDLTFTFNPKGRRGIDHKHITLFSNDPLNPVRTITIKSTIN